MKKNLTFQEVVNETIKLVKAFEKVEKKKWGIEGAMIELYKQVGELSRHVMMLEGYYLAGRDLSPDYKSSKNNIADELSDILFMTIRIAHHYKIDLEKEHMNQMDIALKHPYMKIKKKTIRKQAKK